MYLEKSVYVLVVDSNTEQLFIGDTREEAKSAFEDYVSKNLSQFMPLSSPEVFISVAWEDAHIGTLWVEWLDGEDNTRETQFDFRILATDVITINN